MAGAADWMFGLIFYFVGLFIIISIFSIAGVFNESTVSFDNRFSSSLQSHTNETSEGDVPSSIIPQKSYFKDVFSFFFWNINYYGDGENNSVLVEYMWLIRILFVFIPLFILILTIYYSLPTVSGG